MMRRSAALTSVLLAAGLGAVVAPSAHAADFCADKIGGSTYYQRNFSYGGSVVATICAPTFDRAGNAYLYARGRYASIPKYMKLVVRTRSGSSDTTVQVDGTYSSYVYRYRGVGAHDYHAVMFDGNGTKIVDAGAIDYE
jgi:hypothetical protein